MSSLANHGRSAVSGLTHINFAFASIDPKSYQVSTMESDMGPDLFAKTTAVKNTNPNLKVFASIGGWTFSDNNTATQPLFGEISANADKRKTFANNVLSFLNTYGFDGVDIDWYVVRTGPPNLAGFARLTDMNLGSTPVPLTVVAPLTIRRTMSNW